MSSYLSVISNSKTCSILTPFFSRKKCLYLHFALFFFYFFLNNQIRMRKWFERLQTRRLSPFYSWTLSLSLSRSCSRAPIPVVARSHSSSAACSQIAQFNLQREQNTYILLLVVRERVSSSNPKNDSYQIQRIDGNLNNRYAFMCVGRFGWTRRSKYINIMCWSIGRTLSKVITNH